MPVPAEAQAKAGKCRVERLGKDRGRRTERWGQGTERTGGWDGRGSGHRYGHGADDQDRGGEGKGKVTVEGKGQGGEAQERGMRDKNH